MVATSLKIANEPPPNYAEILQYFPVQNQPIFFAWNDTVYNPMGADIPEDILFHEEIHSKQQQGKPEIWWTKYCTDASFRLQEELQAYGAQYHWIRKHWGAKAGEEGLEEMARILSSPLYALGVSHNEAKSKIHKRAKVMIP